MVEYVPEIVAAGIDSLKIEGRMKTALYVATVARTYRKAIDDYFTSEETYRANMDWYKAEISKCTYRQFTTGFYFGKPDENTQIYDSNTYVNEYTYLGIIEQLAEQQIGGSKCEGNKAVYAEIPQGDASANVACRKTLARIEQRNKFCVGDLIEIMKPDGQNVEVRVMGMYNADLDPIESCPHSKQEIWLELSELPKQYDLLRVKSE